MSNVDRTNTRTIYGVLVQAAQAQQVSPVMLPNSTMNQKFMILNDRPLPAGAIPKFNYIGVGNGGVTSSLGKSNIPIYRHNLFKSQFASLYNHMPLSLRPINDDMSTEAMAKYRLRKVITVQGVQYIARYLRILPTVSQVNPTVVYNVFENGKYVPKPFSPDSNCLNPTPPELSSYNTNYVTANYFKVANVTTLEFDADDIAEYINVARILYGDEAYAMITELGLFSGHDVTVQGFSESDTRPYNEVIACQLAHYQTDTMVFSSTDINYTLDINLGDIDPLTEVSGSGYSG